MAAHTIDGVICFAGDPWGEMKRPGQLMRQLSRQVPVVYVEPQLSVTSVIKNWRTATELASRQRLRRSLSAQPAEMSPGLHVVGSLVTISLQRLTAVLSAGVLEAANKRRYQQASDRAYRAAERIGIRSPLIWVTYPLPLPGAPNGDDRIVVYDCMDRWEDFPDMMSDPKSRAQVTDAERQLLHSADLVFCSAAGLFESKRATAAGKVFLLRNGADAEHFAPKGRSVPEVLRGLPRPIVGYIGAVAEWVDFELLRSVALTRPDWSFVFVGPSFKGQTMGDARALGLIADLPNVHLLGPRPYADVPAYLEAFDVATIPFKLNGLTEDTNPIKVYEYLAAGVPVVSTPLPEVADLAEVRVAADADEFVRQCEAAVSRRTDERLISLRMSTAALNSWEGRAAVAWNAVLDHQMASAERG